ncbi:hypothetical protein AB0N09_42680 [Streptomyces erythrochromogenes]|uniref:hypothetical protein n=1 Tax=Streptomyces erythrochromogenes TaxID=285574 RepID=UPI003429869A
MENDLAAHDQATLLPELLPETWGEIGHSLSMADPVRLTRVNRALHERFKDEICGPEFDFAKLPPEAWTAIGENLSPEDLVHLTAVNQELHSNQYAGGITVRTQDELDQALGLDHLRFIVITSPDLTVNAPPTARKVPIIATCDVHITSGLVYTRDPVHVLATGTARVFAQGHARVTAREDALVVVADQAHVDAYDTAHVHRKDQATVARP